MFIGTIVRYAPNRLLILSSEALKGTRVPHSTFHILFWAEEDLSSCRCVRT